MCVTLGTVYLRIQIVKNLGIVRIRPKLIFEIIATANKILQ